MNDRKRRFGSAVSSAVESLSIYAPALAAIIVSVLDFLGLLDQLSERIPTMVLLLVGLIMPYFTFTLRRQLGNTQRAYDLQSEKLRQEMSQSQTNIIEAVRQTSSVRLLGIRDELRRQYSESMQAATKRIDIIAHTSYEVSQRIDPEFFVAKIRDEECAIRILLLDPDCPCWSLRVDSERMDGATHEMVLERLEIAKRYYRGIVESVKGQSIRGSLTVRFYADIPYFAYSRCDDGAAIIGFYYSFTVGMKAHALLVAPDNALYQMLEQHFEKLWRDATPYLRQGADDIVRIGSYYP